MIEDRKPVAAMNVLRFGAIALSLLSAGCAVSRSEVTGSFSGSAVAELGAGTGIPFQVDGTVAGVRGAALATAVAANMPTNVASKDVHYAACAPFTECAGDHVVWTFGPAPMRSGSNYPAAFHINPDWIGSYRPASSSVAATVSVFQSGTVVSTATGQVNAPDGVNDPAFKSMISELSRSVLSSGLLDSF